MSYKMFQIKVTKTQKMIYLNYQDLIILDKILKIINKMN